VYDAGVRRTSIALAACFVTCAACNSGPNELQLTLTFDPSISNERLGEITNLTFTTGGDETGEFQLPITRTLNRTERLEYLPRPMSRAITLAVAGLDSASAVIAEGNANAIAVGPGLHAAEITLVDTTVIDDAGAPDARAHFDAGLDERNDDDLGPDTTLVAYYKFNEGSGTTAHDSSGNGNDGALSGGPTWVTGIEGSGLSFTAASTMQVPAAADLSGMAAVTVTAWIKLAITDISETFVSDRADAPNYYAYNFSVAANNTIEFEATGPSTWGGSGGSTAFTAGTWYFVAGVYDGVQVQVFVNGVAEGYTNPMSGNLVQATDPLEIGFNSFQGTLDEIRIYKRALSGTELMTLYANP
jgi:hypothetical protein